MKLKNNPIKKQIVPPIVKNENDSYDPDPTKNIEIKSHTPPHIIKKTPMVRTDVSILFRDA